MSFSLFSKAFRLKLSKPATAALLAKAEKKLGSALPKSVISLYEQGNGGRAKHPESSLEMLSIANTLQYGEVSGFLDDPWGLWPLFEYEDSNPLCICCKRR